MSDPSADTPVRVLASPPVPRAEIVKAFIGDLARPFSIYAVAGATALAIIGPATADKVGAAGLILAALYGAKTYEKRAETKASAEVEIAKAQAGAST